MNELIKNTSDNFEIAQYDQTVIDVNYYLQHYADIIPRYIAYGAPSDVTVENYVMNIRHFLDWCKSIRKHPFSYTDYEMRGWQEKLNHEYSVGSVAFMIASVRCFYRVAQKLKLIEVNPLDGIKCQTPYIMDFQANYFTPEQIGNIVKSFDRDEPFIKARNAVIIYLMGIEGLRSVEVRRMNVADIDFINKIAIVKGKGHRGRKDIVYLSDATIDRIKQYLDSIPADQPIVPDEGSDIQPLILSASNRRLMHRITRRGLQNIVDRIFKDAGVKSPGVLCHSLRHSCGTNLYGATKDLRIVQETLRHSSPEITARYAHVHEKMAERPTSKIVPGFNT